MKYVLILKAFIFCVWINAFADYPGRNPISAFYNSESGYPGWTDDFKWNNYIDMSTYDNGANDFEKFENARDELYEMGGGILYYPAGEYTFYDIPLDDPNGRGLMLKKGIVILGEAPENKQNATQGNLKLTTIFKFKLSNNGDGFVPYPWNIIGLMPAENDELKNIDNIGIAWIHLDGATVYFGSQMSWGETYSTAGAWYSGRASTGIWKNRTPDGTHPYDPFAGISGEKKYEGAGKNRFVFGCKITNATVINPKIIDYSQGGEFEYHTYKFGARISVYGSNIFVANNLLPKSDRNFFYTTTTALTQSGQCNKAFGTHESIMLFDYGKSFGIDVNKGYLNVCSNKYEGYFEEGVIVQDNYVYNHGSKGFELSGQWMVVKNNHNERDYLQEGDNVYNLPGIPDWELTVDGYFESVKGGNGCLSDNLSRAYDMAGKTVWIDSNSWNNLGSNPGNDGESILSQRHGGTDIHSWAVTHNSHKQSYNYSNPGYLSGYDVHNNGMLVAWNDTRGTIGNLKAGNLIDCAFITSEPNESFKLDYKVSNPDYINECTEGELTAPSNIDAVFARDSSYIKIEWEDATDEEIGYRIDRRTVGAENWTTVAYRPRQSVGHEDNNPVWRDYLINKHTQYEYRVVAVNCNDNDTGASEAYLVRAKSELELEIEYNSQFDSAITYIKEAHNQIKVIF